MGSRETPHGSRHTGMLFAGDNREPGARARTRHASTGTAASSSSPGVCDLPGPRRLAAAAGAR